MNRLRELERRRDEEDRLTEIQFLSEQARLPGRVGWLANRRRQFLLEGEAPRIEPQPWFDEVIKEQYDYWLKVGLSCEPANRQAAEQVISIFYRRLGAEPPQFVWCASPLAATQAMLEAGNLGDQLYSQLWNQLWNQLYGQLDNQLINQLGNQLTNQLMDQLRHQLWNQLWNQLDNQLRNQLWRQLRTQFRYQLIYANLWGSGDAYWIGYYSAGRELGVCYPRKDLDLLREWDVLAHSCFWWWPYKDVCFISDRPREIEFNKSGELTKCIFRDDWGIDNE